MTGIFTVVGLLAFFTGKIHARKAFWQKDSPLVEGEWVRKLGLVIIVIDLMPLFVFFVLSPLAVALQLDELSKSIMVWGFPLVILSPLLNVLIHICALLFGRSDKDQ